MMNGGFGFRCTIPRQRQIFETFPTLTVINAFNISKDIFIGG
uniref:Uncharacterized protein n=1 Tax=uncultured bacterium contig00062 TaxID=1181545 RepID=A0A806K165_9BACT|nr:hypothetical protein [uncultured bacterium contig00062]